MDCLESQALISAALDHEPVDPDALTLAKEHCRTCSDCIAFVRTLASLQRTPAPQPPDGLAERVAAEARRAVTAEQPAAAIPAADVAPPPASPPAEGVAAPTARPSFTERLRAMNRRNLVAGLATAAALLVFVGVASVVGVRAILNPQAGTPTGQEKTMVGLDGAQPETSRAPATSPPGQPITLPSYVVLNAQAYRLEGPSTETTSELTPAGTVSSTLGASGKPQAREAFVSPSGADRIIVSGSAGQYAFIRVTREYAGTTYVLRSNPVTSFGVWPTLPSSIEAPTSTNGSPTFVAVGQEGGVTVYRLKTGTTRDGIAIAPGSSSSDPAAGNPNWTWWTPLAAQL